MSQQWRDTIASADITFVESAVLLDAEGNPDGAPLVVVSGQVTEDNTRLVRFDFDLEVSDPGRTLDVQSFTGRRVRISKGLRYPGVTEPEMVTLCTGFVSEAERNSEQGTIQLTGMDRASLLQAESVRPVTIPAGRPAHLAIRDLLWSVDATVDWDLAPSQWTLPRLIYEVDSDLMSEAAKLAQSIGDEVYVSRDDRATLRPIPLPEPPERVTFTEGEGATILRSSQRFSYDRVPNGIIVISQHSSLGAPLRGEAWDMDPDSPTYRYGPYRERPHRIQTEKCSNQGQVDAMAAGELQRELGGASEVELEVVADPSVEADDVAMVHAPGADADGLRVVTRVQNTLADPSSRMPVTLRAGVFV